MSRRSRQRPDAALQLNLWEDPASQPAAVRSESPTIPMDGYRHRGTTTKPPTRPADLRPVAIIVDDDLAVREAAEGLLQSVGLEVRTFASVQAFLESELPEGPCCLVLDVRMPGKSGLDLQDELNSRKASLPIVFITGHADVPMSVRAMKGGAVEFLGKPFRDQELLDAIQVGLERDRQRRLRSHLDEALRCKYDLLTPREREVLGQVSRGQLNKQIAAELDLSEVTVKVHRGQAMRKMQARSLADLVLMADRLGLIPGR
jgi:FixJ family two-component response regulator